MKVVLADVELAPLQKAEATIREKGGRALAVRMDVMREEEIKYLADTAFETWGNVHVLCNKAGGAAGRIADGVWNVAKEDWDWALGVNFSGVLYGIRHFVPRMLAKGEAGHIVNTASVAGLLTGATLPPYTVSKHAVVALSEVLYKDLKARKAKISASVVCPGWVNTNIMDAERNRPDHLRPEGAADSAPTEEKLNRIQAIRGAIKEGLQPEQIAEHVVAAIKSDKFYIVPAQPAIKEALALRLDDIRLLRNPTIVPPA
jgi:NAD(P)-dependent dehydrogenase (short-subunit alcohol dehydrogenase family)